MRRREAILIPILFAVLLFIQPGCAVVGGIFKAGVWVGVLLVVLVIALIVWLISRAGKK
jgi:uncharacterized membrane protein